MRRRRNLLHLCVAGKGKYLPRQNSESNRFEMTFRLNLAQKGVEGAFRKTRCHPPRGQCVVFPVDDFHSTFGGRGVKCGFAVCQLDANCYCPLISLDIALPPSSFWKCACPIQRRAAVSMYVCIRVVSFLLVQQLDQDFLEINSSINEASIFFFYSFEVLSSFSVPKRRLIAIFQFLSRILDPCILWEIVALIVCTRIYIYEGSPINFCSYPIKMEMFLNNKINFICISIP